MSKNILAVGLELASDGVQHEEFRSKVSLLDWDIILFRPKITDFYQYESFFQGKPSLNETASFQLKECCEHWRREIKQAIEAGKTVLVFLPPVQEVYIDTGKREYSGTGRNQKTTRIVGLYTNYATLPIELKPVNTTGSAMKLVPLGAEVLAPYWTEFGPVSEYKVLIDSNAAAVCLTTKNGEKPVGAFARSKISTGTLVMLPDIDYYPDSFTKLEKDELTWTPAAKKFAVKLLSAAVALDKALRGSAEVTPEPGWATSSSYALASELTLLPQLLDAERQVEEAQKAKELLQEQINSAGRLRALLYEKGKPLELAIIEALHILDFNANSYKDADSEFDVVFTCPEGRLLGEAEGKDTKAVNVDKLRQLSMNIHEDLQREEVTSPAKGVLFGNGYRLAQPSDRAQQFTEKCLTAAQSSSTALLATSSLFQAVQYLSSNPDKEYAKRCREAILAGIGLVTLPNPPAAPLALTTDTAG